MNTAKQNRNTSYKKVLPYMNKQEEEILLKVKEHKKPITQRKFKELFGYERNVVAGRFNGLVQKGKLEIISSVYDAKTKRTVSLYQLPKSPTLDFCKN